MASNKFETEKFTGKNDFGLWRLKMRALLIQQGLSDVLKGEDDISADLTKEEKAKMMEKVLREVSREKTDVGVCSKLESLYMTKLLENRLYMKQRLCSYKISDDKSILDQLDDFTKAVDDLENIEVTLEDEDKAIIMLNVLPNIFQIINYIFLDRIQQKQSNPVNWNENSEIFTT